MSSFQNNDFNIRNIINYDISYYELICVHWI